MSFERKFPAVQDSLDYRLFLYRYIETMKERRPSWSLGAWSRQLGTVSKATLVKIIKGDRVPGEKTIARLCTYFAFDEADEAYFRSLIQIHKVRRSLPVAAPLMESLQKNARRQPLADLDARTLASLTHWYYEPLIAIWLMEGREPKAEVFAARLHARVPVTEIAEAIEKIRSSGILCQTKDGRWIVSKSWPAIHQVRMTALSVKSKAIQENYVREVLGETIRALPRLAPRTSEFKTVTLPFRADKFEEARELLSQFEARFALLMCDKEAPDLFQLQMQLLPLVKETPS